MNLELDVLFTDNDNNLYEGSLKSLASGKLSRERYRAVILGTGPKF